MRKFNYSFISIIFYFNHSLAESRRIWASGLIVGEACDLPSHWASSKTLDEWLKEEGVPGIHCIDTRALTKK